jgi:hypothetical protein
MRPIHRRLFSSRTPRSASRPHSVPALLEALERRTLMAADLGGGTIATAAVLDLTDQTATIKDRVGRRDTADIFRVDLESATTLKLNLDKLRADADLELLDAAGELLDRSASPRRVAESLEADLDAGTYYVRVAPFGRAGTRYTLQAVLDSGDVDLGQLIDAQSVTGFVGGLDRSDRFTFELTEFAEVTLTLADLFADADLKLRNADGQLLATSDEAGFTDEEITETLAPGVYVADVYPYSGQTTYTLGIDFEIVVTPEPDTDGGDGDDIDLNDPVYSTSYGYGLIDAGAAVAAAAQIANPADAPAYGGSIDWGLNLVRAPEAWAAGFTGEGVVVAVIDSGVDVTHTELSGSIWTNLGEIAGDGIDNDTNGFTDDIRGWDFVQNDATPQDGNGHGTHVAGTIAAARNAAGPTGVAYDALIMPVRVLDNRGSGYDSDVAEGIRYAADNGADVINLSLGGSSPNNALLSALAYASDKGAVVVMASGNEYEDQPGYPGRYASQYGIAVGAVDSDGEVADFSNLAGPGAKDFVMAPGVAVYSTLPKNKYATWNGTSMATPHVAGVAALIKQANPALTAPQIEAILIQTARPDLVSV